MFGLFSAKYPLATYEKTWIEWRMRWFAERIGIARLMHAAVVLPNEQFFPDPYDGSEHAARKLMDRVCGYMGVDPATIKFEVCLDDQMPGAVGHYDPQGDTTIRVVQSQLADPQCLVATLAHELSHEVLLGGGLLDRAAADHEWTTDLLPVFLGIGLFAANATVRQSHRQDGSSHIWSIGRQGYLPSRMFGYAFALFAFMRGEAKPDWARHLRQDARVPFRDGLRFLRRSDDSLFHPQTVRSKPRQSSGRELAARLESGSPTIRLSTLWEIRERRLTDDGVMPAVTARLRDRDTSVAAAAATTLGALGPAAAAALPQLLLGIVDSRSQVRANCARALGMLQCDAEAVVPELEALLDDGDEDVAIAATEAIRRFGAAAAASAPRVLAALQAALTRCNYTLADAMAGALTATSPDPAGFVREYYTNRDPEMRQRALAAIESSRPRAEQAAAE